MVASIWFAVSEADEAVVIWMFGGFGWRGGPVSLRLPISGTVFGSASCLEGLLSGNLRCIGVVGSSFCSLRRVNLPVHPVLTGICQGSVPAGKRRLGI